MLEADRGLDVFMKNMYVAVFNHHIPLYVGHDKYINVHKQALSGEAVWGRISLKLIPEVVSFQSAYLNIQNVMFWTIFTYFWGNV